jgi:hypothetical protein
VKKVANSNQQPSLSDLRKRKQELEEILRRKSYTPVCEVANRIRAAEQNTNPRKPDPGEYVGGKNSIAYQRDQVIRSTFLTISKK